MGELLDKEFTSSQVLYHRFLTIPEIIIQMLPPSVMIATVFTLSGMSRTNELIATFSLGISLGRLMSVLLSVVFIICCATLVAQDRLLPPLFKNRMTYYWREMKKKNDFFLDSKRDKIWFRSGNRIYNLRTFDPKGQVILGLTAYTFGDNFQLAQVLEADRAVFTSEGWRLESGTNTTFVGKDSAPRTEKFVTFPIKIEESPKDLQEIEREIDGLRLKELYAYIKRTESAGLGTKKFEVKLHSKVSVSFIPLVMAALAVPFSTRGRRDGGVAKDLGLCLGITFFYWLFYSIGLSLGTNGALPPVLAAWLPSIIFGVLAVTLIARRKSFS